MIVPMRKLIVFLACLCSAICSAQKVIELKPHSQAYREVVNVASQSLNHARGKQSIFVGNSLDAVRVAGDWAVVFDRVNVNSPSGPKFEWASLFYRTAKGWTNTRTIVGGSALAMIAKARKEPPSQLFKAPPIRLE